MFAACPRTRTQYRPQTTIILIVGTPKEVPPNFGMLSVRIGDRRAQEFLQFALLSRSQHPRMRAGKDTIGA